MKVCEPFANGPWWLLAAKTTRGSGVASGLVQNDVGVLNDCLPTVQITILINELRDTMSKDITQKASWAAAEVNLGSLSIGIPYWMVPPGLSVTDGSK